MGDKRGMTDYIKRTKTVYILYNWRADDIRLRKTKPSSEPFTIINKLTQTYKIPKIEAKELEKEFKLPKAQLKNAILETIPELKEIKEKKEEIEELEEEKEELKDKLDRIGEGEGCKNFKRGLKHRIQIKEKRIKRLERELKRLKYKDGK